MSSARPISRPKSWHRSRLFTVPRAHPCRSKRNLSPTRSSPSGSAARSERALVRIGGWPFELWRRHATAHPPKSVVKHEMRRLSPFLIEHQALTRRFFLGAGLSTLAALGQPALVRAASPRSKKQPEREARFASY